MKSMELLTPEPHQSAEIVVHVDLEAYCTPKKTQVNSVNAKSSRMATGHIPPTGHDAFQVSARCSKFPFSFHLEEATKQSYSSVTILYSGLKVEVCVG